MNPDRYKNMLATLKKQAEANKNKIYPQVHDYPRRFDILDKEGQRIASFYHANINDGYRYQTDKGGLSQDYVPFSVVRDIFKYFKVMKND